MTLKELRKDLKKTQVEVAEAMGRVQPEVSLFEAKPDHRVSLLREYVAALGGKLECRAVFSPAGSEKFTILLHGV